jgi:hypothetical protein
VCTSIVFFASLESVRDFVGDDYELAVVEEASRRAVPPAFRLCRRKKW